MINLSEIQKEKGWNERLTILGMVLYQRFQLNIFFFSMNIVKYEGNFIIYFESGSLNDS